MPATDYQSSSSPFTSFGRSLLSIRRDQMENPREEENEQLEAFQTQVASRLNDLLSANSGDMLSIPWIQKLLDVFLCCQEEFKSIVFNYKSTLNKPPLDRYVSEYFERSVKALDVCNAIRDGLEQIKQWQKQLEIVICSLENQRCLGEGQIRRAKKTLLDLAISMLDEKVSGSSLSQRNRSFGRNNNNNNKSLGHFRSLSWSVSRNWSAARQLQAIGNNLTSPKTSEILSSNGLALSVFTMSYLLYFVMWALVAAIPCQDRGGLNAPFNVSKFSWSGPLLALHERILEASKKRDRKNSSCGLLKEIHEMEKCTRGLIELTETVDLPLTEEKEGEVKERVVELRAVVGSLKFGLDPLERRVREVFHRIVRCRTHGLDSVDRSTIHRQ
ncbi:unnamed protein product [Cuscuta europaea]|uniref:Uncharacterized protein n=1 Tax=Cuscuta europaea TaxID=41803 RepID=A0A9P1EFE3_CUSEU|nr:unnamed protein product [Cuscuta europaea]